MMKATAVRSALLAILSCLSVAAVAQADIPKQIDIPAGDLSDALIRLSKQYGIDLFYRPEQVRGLKTQGAHGELTTEQAISRLIEGTKLKLSTDSTGAMVIGVPAANRASATAENADASAGAGEGVNHGAMQLAQAQTASAQGKAEKPTAEGVGSSEETELQEIVVSAQKRDERLQDVPISISVLNGDRLDRSSFQGVREALNTVPGVAISTDQNQTPSVTIRGVAPISGRFNGSGVAGYYIDTVPFSLVKSAIVPDSNIYDLKQVEVLRGPQGTLYGLSALNGVVRILTHDADLDAFEFKARTSTSQVKFGGWDYSGDMAVNVPIVEGKFAARAVAGYQKSNGWIDRPNEQNANDSVSRNLRLKVNAQPADKLSVGMSAWLSRIHRDAPPNGDENGQNPLLTQEPNVDDFDVYGFTVGYEFPLFTARSMTSYLDYRAENSTDFAPYGVSALNQAFVEAQSFSEEVLLTSTHGGSWRWSVGAIYSDAEERVTTLFPFVSPTPNRVDKDTSESYAVYGELTRSLIDGRVEVTGGLRYFEDKVGYKDERTTITTPISARYSFDKVSPRLALTWHPSHDLTVYSAYAEGFRSGTSQTSRVTQLGVPAAGPDNLKNYELGVKGSLLDGHLGFDAAAYYIDWQNLKQNLTVIVQTTAGPTPTGALINSGSASGTGFDLGLTAKPMDGLNLGATVSWNDLAFDADVFTGSPASLFARKGDRLSNSRELTWGVSADYFFPIGERGFEGQLSASFNHASKQLLHIVGGAYVADPISIGRASFSVRAPKHWGATLFVDNIGNEQASVFIPGSAGPPPSGTPYIHTRPRPRTVSLQLDYRFD